MAKRVVSDWLFKAFLVFATWALTLTALGILVGSLVQGRVERSGGRTYTITDSPGTYTTHIAFSVIGILALLLMALLSLGFIPAVGRRYKAFAMRRIRKVESRRNGDRPASE
jgi:hypothetical protein